MDGLILLHHLLQQVPSLLGNVSVPSNDNGNTAHHKFIMNGMLMKVVNGSKGLARQDCGVPKRVGNDIRHLVGFLRELPQSPFDQRFLYVRSDLASV